MRLRNTVAFFWLFVAVTSAVAVIDVVNRASAQQQQAPQNLSMEQQVEVVKKQMKQFIDNLGSQIDMDQDTIRQRDGTIASDILESQKQAAQIVDLTKERDDLKKERDELKTAAQPKPDTPPAKIETPKQEK